MAAAGNADHAAPLAPAREVRPSTDAETGPEAAVTPRMSGSGSKAANPWGVLLIVSMNTMCNAYMSMNTSAAESAFVEAFHTEEKEIGSYFSVFLFTVLVGMTPGMILADVWEGFGLGFSVFMNVASTWLRWGAVATGDQLLLTLSVIVSAAGAWTILSLPSQISQRRFPRKLWTFTTSVCVQANYAGWLIGALIPPQVATDPKSLERLCLIQAIVASPIPVLFFMLYKPATTPEVQRGESLRREATQQSIGEGFRNSFTRSVEGSVHSAGGDHSLGIKFHELFIVAKLHPRFILQILACGLLGGVSFAQPSATIFILGEYGFSNQTSAGVNVAFISCGVIFGTLIGKICSEPKHFGVVLKALFAFCLFCSAGCALLAQLGYLNNANQAGYIGTLILSGGIGLCSLGFIGIGIEASALYPVGAGYVCWAIEIIVQGVGGALNLLACNSHGFTILLGVVAAAFLLLLVGYRLPDEEE